MCPQMSSLQHPSSEAVSDVKGRLAKIKADECKIAWNSVRNARGSVHRCMKSYSELTNDLVEGAIRGYEHNPNYLKDVCRVKLIDPEYDLLTLVDKLTFHVQVIVDDEQAYNGYIQSPWNINEYRALERGEDVSSMVSRLLGKCREGSGFLPQGFLKDANEVSTILSPPAKTDEKATKTQASSKRVQPSFKLNGALVNDDDEHQRTPLQSWSWTQDGKFEEGWEVWCDILPDTTIHNPTQAEYNKRHTNMNTSSMELWMHKLYSECSATFSKRCIALKMKGEHHNYVLHATTQEIRDKMKDPFWIEDSVTQCTESWVDPESMKGEAGMNNKVCKSDPLIFRQNVRVGVQAEGKHIASVDMLNRQVQLQIGAARLFMQRRIGNAAAAAADSPFSSSSSAAAAAEAGNQGTAELPHFSTIEVKSTAFKSMRYSVPASGDGPRLSIHMAVLLSNLMVGVRDGPAATLQIKTTYVLNDRRHRGHEYSPILLPQGELRVQQHSRSWAPLLKPATAGTSNFTFAAFQGGTGNDAIDQQDHEETIIRYRDDAPRMSTREWTENFWKGWKQHAKDYLRRYREGLKGVVGIQVNGNNKKSIHRPAAAAPESGVASGKKEIRVGFEDARSIGTRTKQPPPPLQLPLASGIQRDKKIGTRTKPQPPPLQLPLANNIHCDGKKGTRKVPLHVALLGPLSQVVSSSGFIENRGDSNQLLESMAKYKAASVLHVQRTFPFMDPSASARSCASTSQKQFLESHVLGTKCTAF